MGWLWATLAFGQDTVACEATDGSGLVYAEFHKDGGAAPGGSTVMDTVTWRRGAEVLHDGKRTYADFGGDANAGVLQWTWDAAATRVVSSTPPAVSQTTVYTTAVRIGRRDGAPIPGLPAVQVPIPMRCTRVEVCCIP
jgi:hypothetical protein